MTRLAGEIGRRDRALSARVEIARAPPAGFATMEQNLVDWLRAKFGVTAELYYAHALRQSPETTRSSTFAVHQDVRGPVLIGDIPPPPARDPHAAAAFSRRRRRSSILSSTPSSSSSRPTSPASRRRR